MIGVALTADRSEEEDARWFAELGAKFPRDGNMT